MMNLTESEIENFSRNIFICSSSNQEKLQNLQSTAHKVDFSNLEDATLTAEKILTETKEILHEVNKTKKQLLIPKFFIQLLKFMKLYEGDLIRGETITPNYRFYDEMEWRYVPNQEILDNGINIGIKDIDTFNEYKKLPIEERLFFGLDFTYDDIENIVVENTSEIDEFKKFLQELDDSPFSLEEREKLCLKIVSTESVNASLDKPSFCGL